MGKIIIEHKIRNPNKVLEGFNETDIKALKEMDNLTITAVQRKLQVGYPRAKEIFKVLRRYREHQVGETHIEWYMNDAKLKWWSKNRAVLFSLGEFSAESVGKEKKIVQSKPCLKQYHCNLLTFDTSTNKVLNHYVLVRNSRMDRYVFIDDIVSVANAYTQGKFYVLDDQRGLILEQHSTSQKLLLELNTDNFDKLIGLTDGIGCMTKFPHGPARIFCDFSYLFAEYHNSPLERSEQVAKEFFEYEGSNKFKTFRSLEEIKPYFDENENAYCFYKNVYLCFDFDNKKVNIQGKCIRARNLTVRNIKAEGLFCDFIDCKTCECDFIISTGVICEELNCQMIKTVFQYGVTQKERQET